MPHLSKLANQYRDDVVFIAVSDEAKEKVAQFLTQKSPFDGKTWNEAMEFIVATDPDQSTKKDIFTAAGQGGIPSSFIIRDGVVQWIGHPVGMDKPLEAVVNQTWDHREFAHEFAKRQKALKERRELFRSIRKASDEGDWEQAISLFDTAIQRDPENSGLEMQKWMMLLTEAHWDEHAYELGRKLVRTHWDNANALNQLAWTVVDHKGVETRDLGFAMKAAVRANELTDLENAALLDTLARVHYEKGNIKIAIHWQRLAVEHAGEDQLGDQVRETLQQYLSSGRQAWF